MIRRSPLHVLALVAILVIAASTRFTGIDHHLRRAGPDFDEANNFVEPVQRMWAKRTADPTVYTGYPGFFNWVAFVPVGVGERIGGEVGAYVGGRALVAAAGVGSVLLSYLLARRLAGPAAGLFAAALLAVSRGEIRAAHYISPDVLVATGALGLLLVAAHGRMGPRQAALLGAACGLTVAIKYTGLFLAPGVAAAIAPDRRRFRLWLVAGLAAAAAFAIAAPYAVARMGGDATGGGFSRAVADYFGSGYAANRAGGAERGALGSVLWLLSLNLGVVGLGLAAVGSLLVRPWRVVAPAVAIALAGIAAMIPAKLVYPRHVLTVSAVAAVLAALGAQALMQRVGTRSRPMLAAILAAAALWAPAGDGLRLAARYGRMPAIDAAAAWIEAKADAPPLVGTTLPRLRLDPERFEVRPSGGEVPREVLAHYPLIVIAPEEAGEWKVLARFDGPGEEQPLVIATPPQPDLVPQQLAWSSAENGSFVEGAAEALFGIVRIEIEASAAAIRALRIEGRATGESGFAVLRTWPLRPGRLLRQRPGAPTGQIYVVWPPVVVEALRFHHGGEPPGRIKVFGAGQPTQPLRR